VDSHGGSPAVGSGGRRSCWRPRHQLPAEAVLRPVDIAYVASAEDYAAFFHVVKQAKLLVVLVVPAKVSLAIPVQDHDLSRQVFLRRWDAIGLHGRQHQVTAHPLGPGGVLLSRQSIQHAISPGWQ